jgi:radical SAM family uncharacterized protein
MTTSRAKRTDLRHPIETLLLPQVQRPGQYVGLEVNARYANVHAADVAVCLAFPDAYSIGISHFGSQVLYNVLNDTPGVAADRTYCPQVDAQDLMGALGIGLWGWESRIAVGDFDVVGFSLPYELCVTNVLSMLHLAGIPIRAAQRGEADPIIVGGDALADTPEPLADFFDILIPGDGEAPLSALVELVGRLRRQGATRHDILLEAARTIPSIYAPAFYEPAYGPGGELRSLRPLRDDVPATIQHAHLPRLSDSPAVSRPLVPLSEAIHDRVVVEVMRGCPNACRFCQAGATRLPVRWRPVEEIIAAARAAIAATGYREISLLSLSTSDYPKLDELIGRLNEEFAPQHVSVSLPSLRVDSQLQQLPRLTSAVRKGGLTIAAEAGSQRLREAIRKDITEEHMLAGVKAAYAAGFRSVKVYFMAGLPGESDDDVAAIFELCRRLSDARREVDGQRGAITASVSWAVPKPHTPMQWAPMRRMEYFFAVRSRLKEMAKRTPITFRFHWIERSVLEAAIARGDRRVGAAIEAAWRSGCRMDSWDEHFDFTRWQAAFAACGLDIDFYAHREIPRDELLPWDHIVIRRDKSFLLDECEKMMARCAKPE